MIKFHCPHCFAVNEADYDPRLLQLLDVHTERIPFSALEDDEIEAERMCPHCKEHYFVKLRKTKEASARGTQFIF